jgi:hypothetical protein
MSIFNKGKPFVGEDIDVFNFTPQGKVSEQHLVKLSNSLLVAWQTVVTHV